MQLTHNLQNVKVLKTKMEDEFLTGKLNIRDLGFSFSTKHIFGINGKLELGLQTR